MFSTGRLSSKIFDFRRLAARACVGREGGKEPPRRSRAVFMALPKVARRRIADGARRSEVSYPYLRFICLQHLSCGR